MADVNGFNFGGGAATAAADTKGMVFDLSGVDENKAGGNFEVLPKGVYGAIVDECEFKESKAGAPMFALTFIVDGGEYDGRKIFDYYVIGGAKEKAVEFGQAKLKKFLTRACPEENLTSFDAVEFGNSGRAVGKKVQLDLGIQTQKTGDYKGEKRNTVKDLLAPATASFM